MKYSILKNVTKNKLYFITENIKLQVLDFGCIGMSVSGFYMSTSVIDFSNIQDNFRVFPVEIFIICIV